jgi:1,4-dihydroxy-2-naphthoate octaprenyltransferase
MLKHWLLAARPKTLWAAVGPVTIGTAMARADGGMHGPSAVACLLGAILLQIGTNFCNDYADYIKGADTPHRVGPARAVASGWIAPRQMLIATVVVFALAAIVCGYLVVRGGWPMLALGFISILAGIAYTAGPYPLAYLGLGDLFVLVFFGPVAVAGTHFVQTVEFSWLAVIAGIAPGLLSVAILTANNLRDVESDRLADKRTLAVRFGVAFARWEYVFCLIVAAAWPLLMVHLAGPQHSNAMVACMVFFVGWPVLRMMVTRSGRELNPALGMTALLLLFYSISFSFGWVMGGL